MHVAQSIARMIPAMLMPIMSVLRIFRECLSFGLFFFIFITDAAAHRMPDLSAIRWSVWFCGALILHPSNLRDCHVALNTAGVRHSFRLDQKGFVAF